MKKDTFKMSIFILLIGGLITKILSFIIRVLFTRTITDEGMNLYTIVSPTFSLLIALASFSLPISISKIISKQTTARPKIMFTSLFFGLTFSFALLLLVLLLAPFISSTLLKEETLTPLIYAMAFTLPFISITSVLKGYFLGKMKVIPNTVSNIFEQLARIIFLIFLLPKLVSKSIILGVVSYILFNIITEIISIFVFYLYLPKKIMLTKNDFLPSKSIINEILATSIPSVSGRIIGNIAFFLEPILLTNILLFVGYPSSYILAEYASYNAYAIGLLTLPSFFIAAICQILIPEISKYYNLKNYTLVKKRMNQALKYSFAIGLFFSIFLFFTRDFFLEILYKTTRGSDYIFILAPFFVLFYLEAPLTSTLQAINKAKAAMKITLLGAIIKLLIMSILSFLRVGIYGLVFSEIINIIIVVFLNYRILKKALY